MLFRIPPKLGSKSSLIIYVQGLMWTWMRDLSVGLLKLNFVENFESFKIVNLDLPVGQEIGIPNQFRVKNNNQVPTSRLIVRQKGNGVIADGPTAWNSNTLFLFNHGPDPVVATVIFFM